MVDSIGPKAPTPRDRRIAPLGGATTAAPIASVADQPLAEVQGASPAAALTASLASEPPVDTDHVARIRQAIADGTFPITPATIADRLLALKMDWAGHDAA
jgi:negative regulator of flagellin synthesis FlgM